MSWRVEWRFPGAAGLALVNERVSESTPLTGLLQAHLTYTLGTASQRFALQVRVTLGGGAVRVRVHAPKCKHNKLISMRSLILYIHFSVSL